jgi:hypothetical protein
MNEEKRISIAKAIEALDALDANDPEEAHGRADAILLSAVTPDLRAAYERVVDRAGEFWFA